MSMRSTGLTARLNDSVGAWWSSAWAREVCACAALGLFAGSLQAASADVPRSTAFGHDHSQVLDHHGHGELPSEEIPSPKADPDPTLPLEAERQITIEASTGTWMSLDVTPDGERLVFEWLGDLYTLAIGGGKATPLLTGMAFESQASFSPNGERIAFISDRGGSENLWIANADGSNPRQLSSEAQGLFMSPEWSADGQYVFVSKSTWGLRTYELWMYH
ncbi:MAG: hypothetical protein AAFX85_01640, partial [Pseudomonadota bacterium]